MNWSKREERWHTNEHIATQTHAFKVFERLINSASWDRL